MNEELLSKILGNKLQNKFYLTEIYLIKKISAYSANNFPVVFTVNCFNC